MISSIAAAYDVLEDVACNPDIDLHYMKDTSCHLSACKDWCDCREDCAAFVYNTITETCWFKAASCFDTIYSVSGRNIHRKL